jgi:hypothetical protein
MSLALLFDGLSIACIVFASVMLGIVIGLVMRGDKGKREDGIFCEYHDHG